MIPGPIAAGTDDYVKTASVGRFPAGASPFGIQDMAGNVSEWTSNRFPGQPHERALRGGGWGNSPYCLRVSFRHGNRPEYSLDLVGFRCAGDALCKLNFSGSWYLTSGVGLISWIWCIVLILLISKPFRIIWA